MTGSIDISNQFTPALLKAFADSRKGRKDLASILNLAMRQMVSFAMAKVRKADKARIKARLEAPATRAKFDPKKVRTTATGKESKAKRYLALRDSLAAYIVYATNWKSKRSGAARSLAAAEFYAAVGRYIGARQFSAGYLRMGLYPGLKTFKAARGEEVKDARYRLPAGDAKAATVDIPEAFVADYADGIAKVAPNALLAAAPEVVLWLQRMIVSNLIETARANRLAAA